jgi:histidinol-phosphate phosphatase family protein
MRPAIFLDKDGTLIEDVPYNVDPARIRLAPGARGAVAAWRAAGYALVVVTNQSGVARGLFPESALAPVRTRIEALLGAGLAGFFWCPHHPDGPVARYAMACHCRKPAPGMLQRAAAALDLDLGRSWMVGDILNDIEAGNRAGCRTILVDRGHETEWRRGPEREPHYRVPDLRRAADTVLGAVRAAA